MTDYTDLHEQAAEQGALLRHGSEPGLYVLTPRAYQPGTRLALPEEERSGDVTVTELEVKLWLESDPDTRPYEPGPAWDEWRREKGLDQ